MTNVIYEPKGKAGEYAELAVNLYKGCHHGCTYCYAPNIVKREKNDFHETVGIRHNIIPNIIKEAPQHVGKKVFLCFTCDPYTYIEGEYGPVTGQAIYHLIKAGCGVEILTKAGMNSVRHFELLSSSKIPCSYGVTLTTMKQGVAKLTEPEAATPNSRLLALKVATEYGINTFVSLEPVLNPEDALEVIRQVSPYANKIKIGRWNYDKRAEAIDWKKFAKDAVELCEKLNQEYLVKKDLAVFLK